MSQEYIDILKRALAREKAARKASERILESKSAELYKITQKLKETNFKLEKLVREKTTELRGVFENIVDAYVVMDLWGNVIKMNDPAISLLGYDSNIEDFNLLSLADVSEIDKVMNGFDMLTKNGSITNFQVKINTKSKEKKLVHINASIILDVDNNPVAAQGIVRDITEEQRAIELIAEQKIELDAIVQNSSIGIVLTKYGTIIRSNESIQKALGYNEQELAGLTVKDITFKEDYLLSKDYDSKMKNSEIDNFVINKKYIKKDGSILLAKTNVSAVRDTQGNMKFQVALIEDITLAKEQSLVIDMINDVAKAILGSVDIYEISWVIINNIAEYLDTQDCIIYVVDKERNTLEQIAGFGDKLNDKRELINKIEIPIGKGIVGSVALHGKAEIINDTSKDSRYIVDDKRRFSEITVPIISEGRVIGVIDSEHSSKNYFTNDQLHTLENIASLVAMQLMSAINLREREKAESKNIILLDELEKSNDELKEYAHIVSHDLKSPLRSIDALISWIREDNKDQLNAATLQNFHLIETTLEKMERLISDVLTYSGIGASTSENEEVDLNLMITDLKQTLFIPKHIQIVVKNKLPVVFGEWTKLRQVFQNLISNAVKYNDKEKGLIEIDVSEKKSFYQFSIKDNGVGIDKKYHDKIFKIFHSLNKKKESTGIGLSIVKKILDIYHGEIWLESELNIGSTFHFTVKK